MPRSPSMGTWGVVSMGLLAMFLFGVSCATRKYSAEISVSDWDYDENARILVVYLRAENTGDTSIKNVRCRVDVFNNITPYAAASKSVTFAGGGKITSGGSSEETVEFRNLSLISSVTIEIKDIKIDPVGGGGCSKPLS